MACEPWQDKLDAYVDGELPTSEATEFSQHTRHCARCSADVLEHVRIKRLTAVAGKAFTPSPDFRAKVMKNVMPRRKATLWGSWRPLMVPTVLTIVFATAVAVYLGKGSTERNRTYSELTDVHVATLASASPVDVVSTDRHTVKPWFEGRIPFSFALPELQGTDFKLIGGKVAYLNQTAGAHLIYGLRKHEISVFIFPERGEIGNKFPPKSDSDFSFNIQSWTKGNLRYFIVGDVSSEDMASLSKLLQDAT